MQSIPVTHPMSPRVQGLVGPGAIGAVLSASLLAQNPPKPSLSTTSPSSTSAIEPIESIQAVSTKSYKADKFRIIEGDDIKVYLDRLESREGKAPAGTGDDESMATDGGASSSSAQAAAQTSSASPAGGSSEAQGSTSMETD